MEAEAVLFFGCASASTTFIRFRIQGRRHVGGDNQNTPHKGHFCKSFKTTEKILGYGGSDVTNHTWISVWVCRKWFSQTPDLTYTGSGRKTYHIWNTEKQT